MLFKIFTVYDQAAKTFGIPFFLPEQGQATRLMTDWVNDPEHAFGKHPEDYTLFEIGGYDGTSGSIEKYDVVKSLGTGVEFQNPA